MNKSRRGSLVVVPNRDYVVCFFHFLHRLPGRPSRRERHSQELLDVGLLVGRVLTLVLRLLVRTVFLSLYQHHRFDHHPQTLYRNGCGKMNTLEMCSLLEFSSLLLLQVQVQGKEEVQYSNLPFRFKHCSSL